MDTLRFVSLIILAALPFLISSLIEDKNEGMERRNKVVRCFISLCKYLTNSTAITLIRIKVKNYFEKLHKSINARKFFLHITGIILITYQLIDFCAYTDESIIRILFPYATGEVYMSYNDNTLMFPYEYAESLLLTAPLFIYKTGNPFLLLLKRCDDRLFLVANVFIIILIFVTDANVISIVLYIIFLAGTFYMEEYTDNKPKARKPIFKSTDQQNQESEEIRIAA